LPCCLCNYREKNGGANGCFLTERNELEVSKVLTVYGRLITGGPQKALSTRLRRKAENSG
jgi:hypothetical protein